MTAMQIVEATDEHLAELEELYIQSIRKNTHGFVQNLNFHGDIKYVAQTIQKNGGSFAVGLIDNRIVAMGGLKRCPCSRACSELCKLHVRAEEQGKGYGKKMCAYFFEQAREKGMEKIELHVTTSQCPAIKLYQTLGFVEDKTAVWETTFENEYLQYETLFMHKDL